MRANLMAIAAVAGLVSGVLNAQLSPAAADPLGGGNYYGPANPSQGDRDDNGGNGGNGGRQKSLSGCVVRTQDDRSFSMETRGRVVDVQMARGATRKGDLDDAIARGREVTAFGRFSGNNVYVARQISIGAERSGGCRYGAQPYPITNPRQPGNPGNGYPGGGYPGNGYPGNGYPGYPYPQAPLPSIPGEHVAMGIITHVFGNSLQMRSNVGYNLTVYYSASTPVIDAWSRPVGARALRAGQAVTVAGGVPQYGVINANSIRIRS